MKRLLLLVLMSFPGWAQGLPQASPESLGMDGKALQRIDSLVEDALAAHQTPGAVVLVGRRGRLVYRRAFGMRSLEPREPMTVDTVFDLASLTKPVATAGSIMILVEQGRVRLNDPLSVYFPELKDPPARAVTVQQLLTHLSGYAAGLDRSQDWKGREGALQQLLVEPLKYPAGSHFEYSDINYIALGLLVERVSGQSLADFARLHLFAPLKMQRTGFVASPPTAPTQRRGGQILRGSVHDHVAARMGGIAGHAGLFAPADDLARFCQMLLNGGQLEGRRVLSRAALARMLRPVVVSETGQTRCLGLDMDTSYSSNRGELFARGSFGHTGFTGTSIWIDPPSQVFVVILTNRVHPDGQGDVVALRSRIATVVAASLTDPEVVEAWRRGETRYAAQVAVGCLAWKSAHPLPQATPVASYRTLNGVDILEESGFRELAGMRLGLVTNQTGRDRKGRLTVDLLHQAPGVHLTRIFSPEHGLRGELDESVADSLDATTGLPVVSLYGERKRPRLEDLAGLDALVFDIQDAGARFYTFSATLRYVLEAAARAGLPVFVLDRPNPIGGVEIEGPIADAVFADDEKSSFTCPHTLPVRHGMTLAELARMYNDERRIGADLRVVKLDPWQRSMMFDQVQQNWVNPSPNLRNLQATLLYPGVCLLEACEISVGRGTDRPFEQIGAPWLNAPALAALLNARDVPGVRFVSTHFQPNSSKFKGQVCAGLQILVVDRSQVRSLRLGLELISALRRVHPEFDLNPVGRLVHHADTMRRLLAGESPEQIEASWHDGIEEFRRRRKPYLLY
ncbi:DUF1343 domain-containing protein [bacterium]|nr:DUF1343 domain-containing protein [bacterium]